MEEEGKASKEDDKVSRREEPWKGEVLEVATLHANHVMSMCLELLLSRRSAEWRTSKDMHLSQKQSETRVLEPCFCPLGAS